MSDLQAWQHECQMRVKTLIQKTLVNDEPSLNTFFEAMNYASLDGGKRVRAMLTFAVGAYLNVPQEELDVYASAVELIHAFSLIHDDLPAMDNDVLRRGKPTCHVAFGEATAILAGDALLTHAFFILSGNNTPYFDPLKRIKMVHALSEAAGSLGMAGGQYLDIDSEKKTLDLDALLLLHRLKTGRLIEVSVHLPFMYAEPTHPIVHTLRQFAEEVGVLFQIQDDILDVTSPAEKLGKTPGKDELAEKASFVKILGFEGAKALLQEKLIFTEECLRNLPGNTELLKMVLEFIVRREY